MSRSFSVYVSDLSLEALRDEIEAWWGAPISPVREEEGITFLGSVGDEVFDVNILPREYFQPTSFLVPPLPRPLRATWKLYIVVNRSAMTAVARPQIVRLIDRLLTRHTCDLLFEYESGLVWIARSQGQTYVGLESPERNGLTAEDLALLTVPYERAPLKPVCEARPS